MNKEKITVVLVDDHVIFREGLVYVLEESGLVDVVGEASTGNEAVDMIIKKQPDLVIMDVSIPEMTGLEVTSRVKDLLPDLKVLILSMYENQEYIDKAFANGAAGYVLKDAAGAELMNAITVILNGKTYLSPSVTSKIVKKYVSMQSIQGEEEIQLTNRETEILQLLALGKTNKEISEKLFISIKTVETHRKNIMTKLDLHNLADVVRYAVKNKIISLE